MESFSEIKKAIIAGLPELKADGSTRQCLRHSGGNSPRFDASLSTLAALSLWNIHQRASNSAFIKAPSIQREQYGMVKNGSKIGIIGRKNKDPSVLRFQPSTIQNPDEILLNLTLEGSIQEYKEQLKIYSKNMYVKRVFLKGLEEEVRTRMKLPSNGSLSR
ncbi:hypothetical protein CR513_58728, partial [Mucuna pruriens]